MKIYTRTGDQGEAGLLSGDRVPKDDLRLEVCGHLDELNCWLGLARTEPLPDEIAALVERLQRQLFDLGTEVAAAGLNELVPRKIGSADVETIETAIDRHEATLTPLATFILPAGSRATATLHVARTVCRRTERRLVSLARAEQGAVSPELLAYINRLSDLLFVLARSANAAADIADTPR